MKIKLLIITITIVCFTNCTSQKAVTTTKSTGEIGVAKYVKTINAEDLKKHLYIVASDEMQGRNTGEAGQKKAGKYLIEQYQKNQIVSPKGAASYYQAIPASYFQKSFSPKLGDSENIWAFIEGSEKPDEILVISAHYDHVGMKNGEIYNGADDDGSGTVALLEIAKAFQQAKMEGNGPKRSILFLHVTGEEHGLHGSRYYTDNPLFPLGKTIADINIDMIGRRDEAHNASNDYVYVIGSDYLSTDLFNAVENANKEHVNINLDYKYNDRSDPNRFYYRSDHYNFAKNNIPSVFFFNGVHADYHQPTDEADKIEYDALEKRTRLAFVVAWELANAKNRPVVDKSGN